MLLETNLQIICAKVTNANKMLIFVYPAHFSLEIVKCLKEQLKME